MTTTLRPASYLPVLKCSSCGADTEISAISDHACSQQAFRAFNYFAEPAPRQDARTVDQRLHSGAGGLQKAEEEQARFEQLGSHICPPARKLPSYNLWRLATAEGSFLAARVSSAGSDSGPRAPRLHLLRSSTAPLPSRYGPPSPELSLNLDSPFPPFPRIRGPALSPPAKKAHQYDDNTREAYNKDTASISSSPKSAGSAKVLRRMNTLVPGPFDTRRRLQERWADCNGGHNRTSTTSSGSSIGRLSNSSGEGTARTSSTIDSDTSGSPRGQGRIVHCLDNAQPDPRAQSHRSGPARHDSQASTVFDSLLGSDCSTEIQHYSHVPSQVSLQGSETLEIYAPQTSTADRTHDVPQLVTPEHQRIQTTLEVSCSPEHARSTSSVRKVQYYASDISMPPSSIPVEAPESPVDRNLQRGALNARGADKKTASSIQEMTPGDILASSIYSTTAHAGKQPSEVRRGDCRGCGEAIRGRSVKAADGRLTGRYHKQCFCCHKCNQAFPTAEFYVLHNNPYCQRHYHELNGSLCQHCDEGIEGQYVEAQTMQKFHPRCFTCNTCQQVLSSAFYELTQGTFCCESHALEASRQAAFLGSGRRHPERRITTLLMMGG